MCGRGESLKHVLEIGQIHTMGGLFLLRHGGPSRIGLPPPQTHTHEHTLSRLAPAGPAQSTPPRTHLWSEKGVLLEEGFGQAGKAPPPQTNCLKASAHRCLVSRSLYFSALLSTRRLRQRVGRNQEDGGPRHRTGQSASSSGLCLSESTVLLCCIDRFAAPMLRPFVEAFRRGFFLGDCGFRNTSFKMEVHYC